MLRVNGSAGFVNAARSVLVVGPDPDDEDLRVVAHAKCNVAELAASQRFQIETRTVDGPHGPIDTSGVVALGAASGVRANDLVRSRDDGPTEQEAAADFLRQTLEDGPSLAADVKTSARAAGFSVRTVERARKRAGVAFRRTAFGGAYEWYLDACSPTDAHARQSRQAGEQGDPVASKPDRVESDGTSSPNPS
jgi:hypothetical protein